MTKDVDGPGSGPDPRRDDRTEQRGYRLSVRSEEQATPDNPQPLTARSGWGYDTSTDQFVADWFDSNHGRARQTSAGWDGDMLLQARRVVTP